MKPMLAAFAAAASLFGQASLDVLNHNRPLLDAHNCYPYSGQWNDRLDRALSTGMPVAIEQDLAWGVDPETGTGRPVLSHSRETTGMEPTLREYFFEHVRPLVERALRDNNRAQWPLITVHFDFKDNHAELHQAVWTLLGDYESWITTAPKTLDPNYLAPLDVKPLLVLTEDNDAQEAVFFADVPVGGKLRLFGSAHTATPVGKTREELTHLAVTMRPEQLLTEKPTNYRRWWNNSWAEVEEGGQANAGAWTEAEARRLKALVDHAHRQGFWIRFYTLDGFTDAENRGWDQGYNFGSRAAAELRWKAAYEAGVNLIATDQFEELGKALREYSSK